MTKEAEETRVKPLPDPPAADKTDKAEKPSERELALEYYKVARAEIIERMKMREAILFAYLTAVSALLTVVLASTRQRSCFCSCHCLVPLLGLGTASIIAQHHEMIGIWSKYQVFELSAVLKSPVMWESCDALWQYGKSSLRRLM
jgi:hypothetical protein